MEYEDFDKILNFRLKEQYDYLTRHDLINDKVKTIRYKDKNWIYILCKIVNIKDWNIEIEM